ncbi:hypothetical protein [Campylobacter phage CJLB-12]|nr:hypothetical protein [Campylobacter phage CJLB-12]
MDINFDWNSMNAGANPFESKSYESDTRFYTLAKDENGNGAALIRFLPSEVHENGSMSTIMKVFKYNVRSKTSKRFIAEWSPSTIGLPDPIQEKWASLWNAGKQDEARRYARSTRYIANIKVIKDPKNPANEGKIFLLDMSQTLGEKIKSILTPNEQELALGAVAKNLFDPIKGFNFKLIATKGANGFIEYSKSDAEANPSAIYNSVEEAVADIKNNAYKLSDWQKPESYKSYEALKELLDGLDTPVESNNLDSMVQAAPVTSFAEPEAPTVRIKTAPVRIKTAPDAPEAKAPSANQADNLDDLMADLLK